MPFLKRGFGLLDCVPRIFSTSPLIVEELKLSVDMANTEFVVSHAFSVLPAQKDELESLPFQLANGLPIPREGRWQRGEAIIYPEWSFVEVFDQYDFSWASP